MEMETNEPTLEMQAGVADIGKDGNSVEGPGENESGIGDDINVSSLADTSGCCSMDINHSAEHGDVSNHATSLLSCSSDGCNVENSFSSGGMKKDDSGIYSEKSPLVTSPKEASDGEFSESMSESLEDNQCTIDFKEENYKENRETGLEPKNNVSANNNVVLDDAKKLETDRNNKEKSVDHKLEKESDTDVTDGSKTCNPDDGEEMQSSKQENDIACGANPDKIVDAEDSKKSSDNEDGSQNEDEDWESFMKNVIKVSSANRRLVDYDDSESDSEQAGASVIAKGHRRYRKRKSDSEGTKDSQGGEAENNGENNAEDQEEDESTPVLLRHSLLQDSPRDIYGLDQDSSNSNSDSSNHEAEAKESSESECEETPMDLSEFGPPKHKWRAVFDLRQREYGFSSVAQTGNFTRKVQGSLQMVQRFELQNKMDYHEGCVNALHFNTTGL